MSLQHYTIGELANSSVLIVGSLVGLLGVFGRIISQSRCTSCCWGLVVNDPLNERELEVVAVQAGNALPQNALPQNALP